jgi:hypothetical protein
LRKDGSVPSRSPTPMVGFRKFAFDATPRIGLVIDDGTPRAARPL